MMGTCASALLIAKNSNDYSWFINGRRNLYNLPPNRFGIGAINPRKLGKVNASANTFPLYPIHEVIRGLVEKNSFVYSIDLFFTTTIEQKCSTKSG